MTIIIFTYNRPDMLRRLLNECVGHGEIFVIDDGSEYDYTEFERDCTYIREGHGARRWFYKKWMTAFYIAENATSEDVLFLQDDVEQVEFERLYRGKEIHVQHILRYPRTESWTEIKAKPIQWNGEDYLKVGFVDCTYKTNKATLQKIDFIQPTIPAYWFMSGRISSGVGWSQSHLFFRRGIPMYYPERTIAKHGPHDSVMHYEVRKVEPLCTI